MCQKIVISLLPAVSPREEIKKFGRWALSALIASACLCGTSLAQDQLSIGFANPLPAYPVWAEADKCFNDAIAAAGIKGQTSGPTGLQVDNQFVLDRISQYIATGSNALIVVPIDGPMYEPLMKEAKEKGMWVVTLNTGDTTSTQDVQLGTDYANQGALVAENLAKREGEQNVIIVGNQPTGVHRVFVDASSRAPRPIRTSSWWSRPMTRAIPPRPSTWFPAL